MLNRVSWASFDFARQKADQPAGWRVFVRDTASGFLMTVRHALMALGVTAIAVLGVLFAKPDLTDRLKEMSPFTIATTAREQPAPQAPNLIGLAMPAQAVVSAVPRQTVLRDADNTLAATARQQQLVTSWLSKRYRVAADATNMLVSEAYLTAKEIKLDPLLILSVMAIESGFNPFAESPVGAQGLMQVMSKVHHDKFQSLGGVKAALNPFANIRVGSLILKDYVTRGGSVEAGLKLYVGAGNMETDFGYGAKVLAEYHRLKEVAMGKNVPIYATAAPVKPRPQSQPSKVETPGNSTTTANSGSTLKADAKVEQVAAL